MVITMSAYRSDLLPLCEHTNKLCVYRNAGSGVYEKALTENDLAKI